MGITKNYPFDTEKVLRAIKNYPGYYSPPIIANHLKIRNFEKLMEFLTQKVTDGILEMDNYYSVRYVPEKYRKNNLGNIYQNRKKTKKR